MFVNILIAISLMCTYAWVTIYIAALTRYERDKVKAWMVILWAPMLIVAGIMLLVKKIKKKKERK